jgi:hypothetical protein
MRLLFLILALVGLAAPSPAQPPSRTCRILFLGAPPGAPEELHLFDGTKIQKVELPQMNFSEPYPLPPGPLTLRLLAEPPADPAAPDPSAPSAGLAANIAHCYLLLTHDPANRQVPVKIQVIDASADRFRTGQMLWFNLTPHRVGGTLGKRRLAIEPGSRTILEPPATGNEPYEVEIGYQPTGESRVRPICRTSWQHNPNARTVHFIIQDHAKRPPRIMGFPDLRPATETPNE